MGHYAICVHQPLPHVCQAVCMCVVAKALLSGGRAGFLGSRLKDGAGSYPRFACALWPRLCLCSEGVALRMATTAGSYPRFACALWPSLCLVGGGCRGSRLKDGAGVLPAICMCAVAKALLMGGGGFLGSRLKDGAGSYPRFACALWPRLCLVGGGGSEGVALRMGLGPTGDLHVRCGQGFA